MTATPSASELIDQAHAATTNAELDAIEAQAEGRVTVINAVHDRRDQLAAQAAREEAMTEAPIVDPSPTATPIMAGSNEYVFPPAEASPQEVLDLKPNDYASATSGPDVQISQTAYVEMTKPDGSTFMAPLANVPGYEAKGYTAGAEQEIEDIGAYWASKSAEAPAPAEAAA